MGRQTQWLLKGIFSLIILSLLCVMHVRVRRSEAQTSGVDFTVGTESRIRTQVLGLEQLSHIASQAPGSCSHDSTFSMHYLLLVYDTRA